MIKILYNFSQLIIPLNSSLYCVKISIFSPNKTSFIDFKKLFIRPVFVSKTISLQNIQKLCGYCSVSVSWYFRILIGTRNWLHDNTIDKLLECQLHFDGYFLNLAPGYLNAKKSKKLLSFILRLFLVSWLPMFCKAST